MNSMLKQIRLDKNMTQAELAEYVDLSPKTISALECGRMKGSIDTLQELAKVLKVDIKELLPVNTISQNQHINLEGNNNE